MSRAPLVLLITILLSFTACVYQTTDTGKPDTSTTAIEATSSTTSTSIPAHVEGCLDTDGGVAFDKKGACISDSFSNNEDRCTDTRRLLEFYCFTDVCSMMTKTCPGGCENGVCK